MNHAFEFNNYKRNTPREKILDELKLNNEIPFEVEFDFRKWLEQVPSDQKLEWALEVKYAGSLSDESRDDFFSKDSRTRTFPLPLLERIRYRNYFCEGKEIESCLGLTGSRLATLPLENRVFEVQLVNARGERMPFRTGAFAPGVAGALKTIEAVVFVGLFLVVGYLFFGFSALKNWFGWVRKQGDLISVKAVVIAMVICFLVGKLFEFILPFKSRSYFGRWDQVLSLAVFPILIFIWMAFRRERASFLMQTWKKIGPVFLLVICAPLIFFQVKLFFQTHLLNEIILYSNGNDHLSYAYQGIYLLEKGRLSTTFNEPFYYSSKPLFIQFLAMTYALFGGGESYFSIWVAQHFLFLYALGLAGLMFFGIALGESTGRPTYRRFAVLTGVLSVLLYARGILGFGATFGVDGYAEGAAWVCALFAVSFLLPLLIHPTPTALWASSVCFCLVICFRSQYLYYFPFLVLIAAALVERKRQREVIKSYCLPLAIVGGLLAIRYLFYLPSRDDVAFYADVATANRTAVSFGHWLRERAGFAFHRADDILAVLLFGGWIGYLAVRARSQKTRACCLLLLGVVFVCIIAIPASFSVGSGYYPRHQVLGYYWLSLTALFLPIVWERYQNSNA